MWIECSQKLPELNDFFDLLVDLNYVSKHYSLYKAIDALADETTPTILRERLGHVDLKTFSDISNIVPNEWSKGIQMGATSIHKVVVRHLSPVFVRDHSDSEVILLAFTNEVSEYQNYQYLCLEVVLSENGYELNRVLVGNRFGVENVDLP